MPTIEERVTTLEGSMSTAQTDIAALEAEMDSAEEDVDELQEGMNANVHILENMTRKQYREARNRRK